MVSSESESPGRCSACGDPLHTWLYVSSTLELHIACAIGHPTTGADMQGPAIHGVVALQPIQTSIFHNRRLMITAATTIAKVVLRLVFSDAVATPLAEVLEKALE